MMLGEPAETPYDLRFQLGKIPVRVHPFFWLITLLMGMSARDAVGIVTWVAACFVSILVHELGHAVTMRWYGEWPRIVLYGMGGLAIADGGFAGGSWGFRRRAARSAWQQIVISAAGPGAGFLLAIVVLLLVVTLKGQVVLTVPTLRDPIFWGIGNLRNPRLVSLIWDLLFINIAWGMVNLLPILPLDGGQITRQLLMLQNPAGGFRTSLVVSIVAGAAMSFVGFAFWHDNYVGFMFAWLAATNYLSLRGPM